MGQEILNGYKIYIGANFKVPEVKQSCKDIKLCSVVADYHNRDEWNCKIELRKIFVSKLGYKWWNSLPAEVFATFAHSDKLFYGRISMRFRGESVL